VNANREASILCKIFHTAEIYVKSSFVSDFVKTCANIAQDKHDEMYLFENIPFVND
jgi:hypothetical protein